MTTLVTVIVVLITSILNVVLTLSKSKPEDKNFLHNEEVIKLLDHLKEELRLLFPNQTANEATNLPETETTKISTKKSNSKSKSMK